MHLLHCTTLIRHNKLGVFNQQFITPSKLAYLLIYCKLIIILFVNKIYFVAQIEYENNYVLTQMFRGDLNCLSGRMMLMS